jgi:hypothetical protein
VAMGRIYSAREPSSFGRVDGLSAQLSSCFTLSH